MVLDTDQLVALQDAAVVRWHDEPIVIQEQGFENLVLVNHEFNFRLWHEEDQARDPAASDAVVAAVKRRIDRLNQQRSDSVEQLDCAIADAIIGLGRPLATSLPMNTETAGSVIDRLSILALRIFHLQEQLGRADSDDAVRGRVDLSLRIAREQRWNVSRSFKELLDDLTAGRKRHQTFHQLKMYNDPELNPAIYQHRGDARFERQ